jgi:hypothetical protein
MEDGCSQADLAGSIAQTLPILASSATFLLQTVSWYYLHFYCVTVVQDYCGTLLL